MTPYLVGQKPANEVWGFAQPQMMHLLTMPPALCCRRNTVRSSSPKRGDDSLGGQPCASRVTRDEEECCGFFRSKRRGSLGLWRGVGRQRCRHSASLRLLIADVTGARRCWLTSQSRIGGEITCVGSWQTPQEWYRKHSYGFCQKKFFRLSAGVYPAIVGFYPIAIWPSLTCCRSV